MERITSNIDYCDTHCDNNKNRCSIYSSCINRKSYEKAKYYEDLDKQEKVAKLPCSVGDTVYYIAPKRDVYEKLEVRFFVIFSKDEIYMKCDSVKFPHLSYGEIDINEIGKTVFLTEKEAKHQSEVIKSSKLKNKMPVSLAEERRNNC